MIGETKKVIEEARCGYCVEAENYQKLAIVIERFANEKDEDRKIMAENSFKYYKKHFNKEKFIDKIESILMF